MATVSPEPSAPANEGDDARRLPKVLLTDPFLAIEVEGFRRLLPGATLAVCTSYDDTEFARLAADADVLVTTLRRIDAETLAMAPRARFIQQFGVGYDPIDGAAVKAAGITVAYNPGVNRSGAAEHAIMLMLALIKRLASTERATRAGQFAPGEIIAEGIDDLADATVGLIGMGHIGQSVAARLVPFGSTVVYHARRPAPDAERLGARLLPLEDLLATLDHRQSPCPTHARDAPPHRPARAGVDAGGVLPGQHRSWRAGRRSRPCARAIESGGHLGGRRSSTSSSDELAGAQPVRRRARDPW